MLTPTLKIIAASSLLATAAGLGVYFSTVQVACIDSTGHVTWARYSCPSGTTQVPNACDLGYCVACPPEGCPETTEALMCCIGVSGPGDCFAINETIGECPPDGILVECDYGVTNPDGSETCFIP